MSKELYQHLLKAPTLPVSMETVFGSTYKERHLSLYNDYVFYRSTWSFFRCTDLNKGIEERSLEVPAEFSLRSFVSRYLSSIDPQSEDSLSFGVPVFCSDSAVTLPASVGQRFEPQEQVLESASSQIHAPIEDDEEDDDDEEDEDEDEDDPENNW
jgi:hypothetical protein